MAIKKYISASKKFWSQDGDSHYQMIPWKQDYVLQNEFPKALKNNRCSIIWKHYVINTLLSQIITLAHVTVNIELL